MTMKDKVDDTIVAMCDEIQKEIKEESLDRKNIPHMAETLAELVSARNEIQNQEESFTTERIVNIHDLEDMIISAYDASQIMEAELYKEMPNMECVKAMSQITNENLKTAEKFEFRIERRTIYPK